MDRQITILWDLDGTLYPETHEIKGIFRRAACNALRKIVNKDLSDEKALGILEESRRTFGDSFSGLIEQGYSADQLHQAHHDQLDHRVLRPDKETIRALTLSAEQGICHVVMTHGHASWSRRALDQVNLGLLIPDKHIISTEKIDFLKKHKGPEAFVRVLDMLRIRAQDTVIVDDKKENLFHPHPLGIKTIHLCRDMAKKEEKDFIWRHCATPSQAVDHVLPLLLMKDEPSLARGPA